MGLLTKIMDYFSYSPEHSKVINSGAGYDWCAGMLLDANTIEEVQQAIDKLEPGDFRDGAQQAIEVWENTVGTRLPGECCMGRASTTVYCLGCKS